MTSADCSAGKYCDANGVCKGIQYWQKYILNASINSNFIPIIYPKAYFNPYIIVQETWLEALVECGEVLVGVQMGKLIKWVIMVTPVKV